MNLRLIQSISDLQSMLSAARRQGRTIGFVPTMGALHAGHGSLIEAARNETDLVVVSIFVNPTQFDRSDDFERYPRDLMPDLEFCDARGTHVVFAPEPGEMYPAPHRTWVDLEVLTGHLCGQSRPGHFRGVATVVLKLFNIVQPDRSYFGEKDAQQLTIIRKMVHDLNVPVTVIAVPTVREPDGLAMSSRNRHLNPEERQIATVLYQALQMAQREIASGAENSEEVRKHALGLLNSRGGLRVEYFEIVDPGELQPVDRIKGPVLVAGAIWTGSTRLIDNILCHRELAPPGSRA